MNDKDEQAMYDAKVKCPKCGATGECEDLRRSGNSLGSQYMRPHKERIRLFRETQNNKRAPNAV
jgi:hypothetical protein